MNIEKLFELAETANDATLVWLITRLMESPTDFGEDMENLRRFHGLYGSRVVAIVKSWQKQGLDVNEMIKNETGVTVTRFELSK
jgi:hypothetical protein